MTRLDSLEDLDLTTVELEDGAPLAVVWRAGPHGTGTWVAQRSLPASAIALDLNPMPNLLSPEGFYSESGSVQDVIGSFLRYGFNSYRRVTEEDPDGPSQARSCLLTDYRRMRGVTEIGSNGSLFGLTYGTPSHPAGGFANLTTIVGEVRGSEDPANEIGGCVASLQLGTGGDPPPTASLWGSSYTLRGSVGRQPGALMAYTAIVQNHYDGPGSRSPNYGYAAITRPGIGDGRDFHVHDPIRESTTYPVDLGFVVCGDSGPSPDGGGIGYRVAFQAGGAASSWAEPHDWRSRIGTGLLVRDWLDAGIHIHPPHTDAGPVPQLRLDRRELQHGNLLECRTEDGQHLLAAIRPDGRLTTVDARDQADAVTKGQLDHAVGELAAQVRDLTARLQVVTGPDTSSGRPDLSGISTRALGRELRQRTSPLQPSNWRRGARRALGRLRPH